MLLRAARTARYAAAVAAAVLVLAGCGSSSVGLAGQRSAVGVGAAAREFAANLEAAHYAAACEAFTAHALASLKREPGHCNGSVGYLFSVLAGQLNKWMAHVLPQVQVQGDVAVWRGVVQARYEHGRWHLENAVW